jgi:tartrate dehydratase alpha subunit/fumarate hydratase class I-like protein
MIAAMARRRISDEKTLTACHEAGHATIFLWVGVPFQSASITSVEDSLGRVVPQGRAVLPALNDRAPDGRSHLNWISLTP